MTNWCRVANRWDMIGVPRPATIGSRPYERLGESLAKSTRNSVSRKAVLRTMRHQAGAWGRGFGLPGPSLRSGQADGDFDLVRPQRQREFPVREGHGQFRGPFDEAFPLRDAELRVVVFPVAAVFAQAVRR